MDGVSATLCDIYTNSREKKNHNNKNSKVTLRRVRAIERKTARVKENGSIRQDEDDARTTLAAVDETIYPAFMKIIVTNSVFAIFIYDVGRELVTSAVAYLQCLLHAYSRVIAPKKGLKFFFFRKYCLEKSYF